MKAQTLARHSKIEDEVKGYKEQSGEKREELKASKSHEVYHILKMSKSEDFSVIKNNPPFSLSLNLMSSQHKRR